MQRGLLPLPGYVQVTTTEPDMITFDDSPHRKRAKMPCGHVISQESMTDYCRGLLAQGKHTFPCPYLGCNVEWKFFIVKHVATLTPLEIEEFERRILTSEMSKDPLNQLCPHCKTWIRRKDLNSNCVECCNCTSFNGLRKYCFCCVCLGEWKGSVLGGMVCGNSNCKLVDKRIQILATCPEKEILKRVAPSVRGCPKCGTLFEYKEFCTQMNCSGCKHFFCFYCLQGANTKAELKCRPYDATCVIAPRQTTLPGF